MAKEAPRAYRPLSRRLISSFIKWASLLMLLLILVQAVLSVIKVHRAFNAEIKAIAETNVPLLSVSVWDIEDEAVKKQLELIAKFPDIGFVHLSVVTGPVFEVGDARFRDAEFLHPVDIPPPRSTGPSPPIARLDIYSKPSALYLELASTVGWTVLSYLTMTILMCVLISVILKRQLEQPLTRIASFVSELTPQTLTVPIEMHRGKGHVRDEIDLVAEGFGVLQTSICEHIQNLDSLVEQRTAQVQSALRDVGNLLDNSGQGFLSFPRNLVVNATYSRACVAMLGQVPAGLDVARLLFGSDASKLDLFRVTVSAVFDQQDDGMRECMLSLLPREISSAERLLRVEYSVLPSDEVMVVLSDVTEERRMAQMLESRRCNLEMVVLAVTDSHNFFDLIESFRDFLRSNILQFDGAGTPSRLVLRDLYRHLHTYKGLFSQFGFQKLPSLLHEWESSLSAMRNREGDVGPDAVAQGLNAGSLARALADDLLVITHTLGEDFLQQGESVVLSEVQVRELEGLALRLLSGEAVDASRMEMRSFLNDIMALRKISLSEALKAFDGLLRQCAERMGKQMEPIEIEGDHRLAVDPVRFRPFLRSLVHVFRNAVAHGIEAPETRWELEKHEAGRVRCTVMAKEGSVHLTISDDGGGIDVAKLRDSLLASGACTSERFDQMSSEDQLQLVFLDGISTSQEVSSLMGRGVGLSAVKQEAQKLGGKVVVRSRAGHGTGFLFVLPLVAPDLDQTVSEAELAKVC